MVEMVCGAKVADIEAVDQGEIDLGVFHVQMALEVTGVVHGHDHVFVAEAVFAEDVQTIFRKVAVET